MAKIISRKRLFAICKKSEKFLNINKINQLQDVIDVIAKTSFNLCHQLLILMCVNSI